jgi:hypothetical protein
MRLNIERGAFGVYEATDAGRRVWITMLTSAHAEETEQFENAARVANALDVAKSPDGFAYAVLQSHPLAIRLLDPSSIGDPKSRVPTMVGVAPATSKPEPVKPRPPAVPQAKAPPRRGPLFKPRPPAPPQARVAKPLAPTPAPTPAPAPAPAPAPPPPRAPLPSEPPAEIEIPVSLAPPPLAPPDEAPEHAVPRLAPPVLVSHDPGPSRRNAPTVIIPPKRRTGAKLLVVALVALVGAGLWFMRSSIMATPATPARADETTSAPVSSVPPPETQATSVVPTETSSPNPSLTPSASQAATFTAPIPTPLPTPTESYKPAVSAPKPQTTYIAPKPPKPKTDPLTL